MLQCLLQYPLSPYSQSLEILSKPFSWFIVDPLKYSQIETILAVRTDLFKVHNSGDSKLMFLVRVQFLKILRKLLSNPPPPSPPPNLSKK